MATSCQYGDGNAREIGGQRRITEVEPAVYEGNRTAGLRRFNDPGTGMSPSVAFSALQVGINHVQSELGLVRRDIEARLRRLNPGSSALPIMLAKSDVWGDIRHDSVRT